MGGSEDNPYATEEYWRDRAIERPKTPSPAEDRGKLVEFVKLIADRSCERFPHPPPTRLGALYIFPSNCLTQKQEDPCRTCRARALLEEINE